MRLAAPWRSGWMLAASFAIVILVSGAVAQDPAPTTPPAAPPAAADGNTAGQQATPPGSAEPPAPASDQNPVAQEAPANDQGSMFVFKKQVEEVVLHATVFDEQRCLVPGLDRSAFSVMDDGAPQTITSFRREDVPVAMGIVIDNSGSMRDKREQVNQAVVNLIRASNPEDQIFVVNFSQNYYLDQDFTSDVNLLQTALHQVSATGSTALYDAIVASAVHLGNNHNLDKKVLLVITDGQDNMSQETLQEATRRLQQANGPTLYAIGLMGSGLRESGRNALQQLAAGSGGVAYFPDSLDQVDNITRTVAHDIRSQYMIAYKPRKHTGQLQYQSVQIQAQAAGYGRLTVRTKSGYYSAQAGH